MRRRIDSSARNLTYLDEDEDPTLMILPQEKVQSNWWRRWPLVAARIGGAATTMGRVAARHRRDRNVSMRPVSI
jgi:hypothetical protein